MILRPLVVDFVWRVAYSVKGIRLFFFSLIFQNKTEG